jgi:VCBS repeat-containing protein
VAGLDTYTVADNALLDSAGFNVPGLLDNDRDPENEALAVVTGSSDSVSRLGAAVRIQTNGEFTYDPRASVVLATLKVGDPALTDTFKYVVADATGLQTTATVTVTVTGANSNPVPADDQYSTAENVVLVIPARGVLDNDTDPDSNAGALTAVVQTVTSQYGARVQVRADGGFSYDPTGSPTLRALETGQSLQDSFSYQVRDDGGATAVGTVQMIVNGVSDPPYQNAANHADVNADGVISPMDALILINYLNANGAGSLPAGMPKPPYLDVNGDGAASAADVIIVINTLNAGTAAGEGEGDAEDTLVSNSKTVAATPAPWGVSSFDAVSYAVPASGFNDPAPTGSRSTAGDRLSFNRVCTPVPQPVSADPGRSVFDAWDEDGSEWEDTLAMIAEGGSGTDREAATDALLGSLFG